MSTNDIQLFHPQWSSNERSLLLLYGARSDGGTRRQIGAMSYPDGKFRTITNDTNHYVGLSLSADTGGLVSVVSKTTATIEVWPGDGSGAPTAIVEARETIRGFDWTSDGSVLYPRGNQLLVRTFTGPERTLFVSDMNTLPSSVDVCGGSGAIVFVWPFRNNSTTNIWRINADGTQPQQLTDYPVASVPACSPDGEWVAFMAVSQVFRMQPAWTRRESGTDGEPQQHRLVARQQAPRGDDGVSGEGRRNDPHADVDHAGRWYPAAAGGRRSHRRYQVTPDGSAVAYRVREHGVDGIQVQPLDGSPRREFMILRRHGWRFPVVA